MLTTHIDYVIGLDIMGYVPAEIPIHAQVKKGRAESVRTLWKNEQNDRFYFHPSTSAEHSRLLVKKMTESGFEFRMYFDKEKWICSFSKGEMHYGASKNDNEAICFAALNAFVNEG